MKTTTTKTMWIPTKLYDSLPGIYLTVGTTMISGSIYVGVDHGPAIGYLIVGAMSISAGIIVSSLRRSARSRQNRSRT